VGWSNWQQLGTWTAPARAINRPQTCPSRHRRGRVEQTFSSSSPIPDGFADLSTTYMLINSVLNWPNACYTFYDRNANKLSLLKRLWNYFVGSVTPGQSATIQTASVRSTARDRRSRGRAIT